MVTLRRVNCYEASKKQSTKEPTTKELMRHIQSIKDNCICLTDKQDGLSEEALNMVTSTDVPLSNLYAGLGDILAIDEFLTGGKESNPMSPAYALSHLNDLEYDKANPFIARYKKSEILNPRVYFRVKIGLNKVNRDFNQLGYSATLSFPNQSHNKAYDLYSESVSYLPILTLSFGNDTKPMSYEISNSFSKPIGDLTDKILSDRSLENLKDSITKKEELLKMFSDKPNSQAYTNTKSEIEKMKQQLSLSQFSSAVRTVLENTESIVKKYPKQSSGKITGNLTQYRNEETMSLAIDKSTIGSFDRNQSHIVVSLYFTKTKDGYKLVCFGNQLADTANLHLDNDDRLTLN